MNSRPPQPKAQVEFAVDVPREYAFRWVEWVQRQPNYDADFVQAMIKSGGGRDEAALWWVSTKPAPAEWWVEVNDLGERS